MTQTIPTQVNVCKDFSEISGDNEYNDIQRAIDSDPFHDDYILKLCSNFDDNQTIIITDDKKIIIDGQGVYGISFQDNHEIATPSNNCSLIFRNMKYLSGDPIIVRYDCEIGLYNCYSVNTSILNIGGKYATIDIENTNITGSQNYPVIEINHSGSVINIRDSFMKGGYHSPSIYFNSESEDKLKIKNTTLLHADDEVCAIQKNQEYNNISLLLYNCYGAHRICDAGITALIDNRYIDNKIKY